METPSPTPKEVTVEPSTLSIYEKFRLSQKYLKHEPIIGYEKYFPCISLYGPSSVTFNPGPNFQHAVPEGALPYSSLGSPVPATVAGLQKVVEHLKK
jgi:hypothetical protein